MASQQCVLSAISLHYACLEEDSRKLRRLVASTGRLFFDVLQLGGSKTDMLW
jgi:hypothetical protein